MNVVPLSCQFDTHGTALMLHSASDTGTVPVVNIHPFSFLYFFTLSCHGKQTSNLNTMLCQTHLLCQGKLYECKSPLDAQVLLIYLFLLVYFIHINAEPDGAREEGEQRKREMSERYKERETRQSRSRQWEKQHKTRQLAATSVERLNRKHPMASVGKPGEESSEAPADRQTEREKKGTNNNSTSSKHMEHNCRYGWFETTGWHSSCMISMWLSEWMCVCVHEHAKYTGQVLYELCSVMSAEGHLWYNEDFVAYKHLNY